MRFGSVCSGIEAASVAWEPLGWTPAFLSEIDAFPRAVLAHRFPAVPLHGDFTTIEAGQYDPIDLLVGGTPCQSFSVAGLRGGLGDDRGNLALEYLRLADRLRPRWLVWENVPGVLSSDGGRDFGSILGGLVELGYGFAYRVLDAQHVRVDGLERAVPQRRRRVFVVGYLGDWRRAAAVLFERESLSGHPAPRREAGQRIADSLTVGANQYSGFCGEPVEHIASTGEVSHCLNAGGMGRIDYETETMIAHALRAEGFDAGEDGTGRGTPLVPIAQIVNGNQGSGGNRSWLGMDEPHQTLTKQDHGNFIAFDTTQITSAANRSVPKAGDPCHPLAAGAHPPAIAFDARQSDVCVYGDRAAPLDTDAFSQAIALQGGGRTSQGSLGPGWSDEGVSYTLNRMDEHAVAQGWAVRRLTPTECERLQGFPDGWTDVPYRGKRAADGPRYKALGNSMAVNVMRWIGGRIEMVDAIREAA